MSTSFLPSAFNQITGLGQQYLAGQTQRDIAQTQVNGQVQAAAIAASAQRASSQSMVTILILGIVAYAVLSKKRAR